jgi:hypothetical protein
MRSRPVAFLAIVFASTGTIPASAQDVQPGQIIGPVIDLMARAMEAERYKNSPEGQAAAVQPGGLTRSQVMIVQQLLTQRGYDVGPVDGWVGAKTMTVVAQLQQKAGVTPTGLPDQRLLEALLAPQ